VQLIRLARNEGRCRGRNRLAAAARARHFLFLDSDMAPDHADFLGRWVRLIAAEDPACAVGGFTLKQTVVARAHALHAAMQERAECVPASVRRLRPEKYVYTSNMLVRRDVFAAEAFDEGFSGWGWEDVEWGMRVAARFGVVHIENAASHLGLDTAPALAEKYRQSAANFARALAKHPQIVRTYPSYRTARLIRRLPGHGALAAPLRRLALAEAAPLPLRVLALKLHRAALYAQVI
jgi:plasmid stabilization system protein ParE